MKDQKEYIKLLKLQLKAQSKVIKDQLKQIEKLRKLLKT